MKKIVNINTNEEIQGTGLYQINNNIRWEKRNSNGDIIDSGIVYCPNMWTGMDSAKVEAADVDLTGREISYNFSTALIYIFNCLELDLQEWQLQ